MARARVKPRPISTLMILLFVALRSFDLHTRGQRRDYLTLPRERVRPDPRYRMRWRVMALLRRARRQLDEEIVMQEIAKHLSRHRDERS